MPPAVVTANVRDISRSDTLVDNSAIVFSSPLVPRKKPLTLCNHPTKGYADQVKTSGVCPAEIIKQYDDILSHAAGTVFQSTRNSTCINILHFSPCRRLRTSRDLSAFHCFQRLYCRRQESNIGANVRSVPPAAPMRRKCYSNCQSAGGWRTNGGTYSDAAHPMIHTIFSGPDPCSSKYNEWLSSGSSW